MKRVIGSIPITALLVLLLSMVFLVVQQPKVASATTSRLDVEKINPVPGSGGGLVETEWGNHGTILKITIKDPDITAAGTQVVVVTIKADEGDAQLGPFDLQEGGTQGTFVVSLHLVVDGGATSTPAVVGTQASDQTFFFEVEDDDEISIVVKPKNDPPVAATDIDFTLSETIFVENDEPNIGSVGPEHEDVVDDEDVDILFDYTDNDSGIPEPEDLPDTDNDEDYTTAVLLINDAQCTDALLDGISTEAEIAAVDCNGGTDGGTFTIRQIGDENDFDEIDDGFEVDTSVNFDENVHFFTILAFDAAGNFEIFDADRTDNAVALVEFTVDLKEPVIDTIRTGVKWDSVDDEYDDDREWLQVLFKDATDLDPDSIDEDDFVVEGHTVRRVQWFNVDPEEVEGGPDNNATAAGPKDVDGSTIAICRITSGGGGVPCTDAGAKIFRPQGSDWGGTDVNEDNKWFMIRNMVFVQLEDELEPDEEPEVNIVPDGIDDEAGNDISGEEADAQDWIEPKFTILEITGSRGDKLIVGEDDEIELIIRSDEDLDDDPIVRVSHVDRATGDDVDETDEGAFQNFDADEIGISRWRVTIDVGDFSSTGYYNIFITGTDKADDHPNEGTEGIDPVDFADDDEFWKKNGDVNEDDAIFYEADYELPDPGVFIDGLRVEEEEDEFEFRDPFFIEINFDESFVEDELDEDDEYAEDTGDFMIITSFKLDGVDLTDQVRTTDDKKFLVAIDNIAIGAHEIEIQAVDEAGNELDDVLEVEFEVEERDTFDVELNPGWNLMSIPNNPAETDINAVFGAGSTVTTVYTFDPTVPGGWLVAVRESDDDSFVGDLTDITSDRGYWVLADEIVEVSVDFPRLSGGAVGGGTPIQPPIIQLFPGWNLVPIIDVTGNTEFGDFIDVDLYFGGVAESVSRIQTFNTITNSWEQVPIDGDPIDTDNADTDSDPSTPGAFDDEDLEFGRAYWVFMTEAETLVP